MDLLWCQSHKNLSEHGNKDFTLYSKKTLSEAQLYKTGYNLLWHV